MGDLPAKVGKKSSTYTSLQNFEKIYLGKHIMIANLLASLEIMLWGMVGIFVIIGLIFVSVLILSVVSSKTKKKDESEENA